jgi:hypothetical protein
MEIMNFFPKYPNGVLDFSRAKELENKKVVFFDCKNQEIHSAGISSIEVAEGSICSFAKIKINLLFKEQHNIIEVFCMSKLSGISFAGELFSGRIEVLDK